MLCSSRIYFRFLRTVPMCKSMLGRARNPAVAARRSVPCGQIHAFMMFPRFYMTISWMSTRLISNCHGWVHFMFHSLFCSLCLTIANAIMASLMLRQSNAPSTQFVSPIVMIMLSFQNRIARNIQPKRLQPPFLLFFLSSFNWCWFLAAPLIECNSKVCVPGILYTVSLLLNVGLSILNLQIFQAVAQAVCAVCWREW